MPSSTATAHMESNRETRGHGLASVEIIGLMAVDLASAAKAQTCKDTSRYNLTNDMHQTPANDKGENIFI